MARLGRVTHRLLQRLDVHRRARHRGGPNTAVVTKTTGITGAATSPNVVIDWGTSDFSTLTPSAAGAEHVVHVTARRTSDTKDRVFRPADPITIALYTAPA